MKYVVSVSKTYIHRGKHVHKSSTKKKWFVYYYDEDGNFKTMQVSWIHAIYYKTQKRKRLRYICTECFQQFMGLVRFNHEELKCPYCT